jgi:hypothetical protein
MEGKKLILEKKTGEVTVKIDAENNGGNICFLNEYRVEIGHGRYSVKPTRIIIENMTLLPAYNGKRLQQKAMTMIKNHYHISEFHC